MQPVQIPLILGDKVDNNTQYRDALSVNMFTVPKQILDSAGYLINWYGLDLLSEAEGVDRGCIWVSASELEGHYRVSGEYLIKVNDDYTYETIGFIGGDSQASMDYSFNNLAIVAGGNLYYYNPEDGLRVITDSDIGTPIDITWVDGYFFLTDGEDIYHSDITNEESFLPLDFGNPQFLPDGVYGVGKNEDNEILVFGKNSIEHFLNVGSENFAFQRLQQKAQKIGISGVHCKKEMNGNWYIIGRRKEAAVGFHITSLGSQKTISTREIEIIISQYTPDELSTSTIDVMIRDGMKFVMFHLPGVTLVFNESVGEMMGLAKAWSILKTDVKGDGTYRGRNILLDPRTGDWTIGDKFDGTLGAMDESICTHYGDVVEAIIDTPFMHFSGKIINEIRMETIPGISPDNDATLEVSVTRDGRTRTNGVWVNMGKNFHYNQQFILRNPAGFTRNYIGFRFRAASRSRMSFASLLAVVS